MKEGEEEAYRQVTSQFWSENHWTETQVIDAGFMEPEDKISGSEQHYDFFESLLTGNIQSWSLARNVKHLFLKQVGGSAEMNQVNNGEGYFLLRCKKTCTYLLINPDLES